MISYFQALVLGALQGLTELFPISSLGHTVLLPSLLGWPIDQQAEFFVIFLVATHLATALVLLGFFFDDWVKIAKGFFRSVAKGRIPLGDTYARIAWLLIIATVPAGLLGLVFEKKFTQLFATPHLVALFLIGNGFLLYGAEMLRKRGSRALAGFGSIDESLGKLSFLKALGIGCMQALALLPGFSRTGATLAGGLLSGLSHESAARFSFLLATPIIFAAAALKLPKLIHASGYPTMEILFGAVVAGIAAYVSVRFLTKYFKNNTLVPFAVYCGCAGLLIFLFVH